MLIKLPIILNNKIDIINFKINKFENKFIIKPLTENKDDLYQFMVTNKEFCMNTFHIKFPYEITIIDNKYLFSNYFFITSILNGFHCELNFFSNILINIEKHFNKKLNFFKLDYLLNHVANITKKCNILIETKKKFEDLKEMESYLDTQLTISLNLIYLLLYKFPQNCSKDFKESAIKEFIPNKIINCLNLIKNYKINFKGNEDIPILNHIDNIVNNKIQVYALKKNNYFFFQLNENKIIKMKVQSMNNNTETLLLEDGRLLDNNIYKVYSYNPKFLDQVNLNHLIMELLKHDYHFRLLISSRLFKKEEQSITNIINYIYLDKSNYIYLSSLRNLHFCFNNIEKDYYNNIEQNLEFKILEDDITNYEFITYLHKKYTDDFSSKLDILKILFNKYTFPLAFNKKKLNENFEAIIYFSFLNINNIVKIVEGDKIYLDNSILEIVPVKLKNLYFNLTKTYYQYKLCSLENITYNFKYYQDYIYIYVIKNIIQNNTIITNLFTNKEIFAKMIDIYQRNFILLQLVNDLNWSNLSKRLDYLHYIFKNENLIYYQNKLNKNLFGDTIDYKIKNIILDKFSMYKYLKKEKDFIKWTKFIKNNINELYEKKISVSDADLILLGKLIHKLYNVEVQDLKDSKYIDLVNFCQKNKKLILSDNRINLMIREKFNSIQFSLNLGFFAKHLNFSNNIEQKIELEENIEINTINMQLKKVTKKYYKYKGKYMRTKTTTCSSSFQI
jgi:hypothetical protein